MTAPTVHLNGTNGNDLYDAARAASLAVRDARAKLTQAYPNGRDYYPQGPVAHRVAVDEWITIDRKLAEVEDELGILVDAIDAQVRR